MLWFFFVSLFVQKFRILQIVISIHCSVTIYYNSSSSTKTARHSFMQQTWYTFMLPLSLLWHSIMPPSLLLFSSFFYNNFIHTMLRNQISAYMCSRFSYKDSIAYANHTDSTHCVYDDIFGNKNLHFQIVDTIVAKQSNLKHFKNEMCVRTWTRQSMYTWNISIWSM